ncbi:hypothetical protein KPL71_011446 [Citrus sinensis]|nr:hypothetical protein KPL71_011446 [Citrus sinensis]
MIDNFRGLSWDNKVDLDLEDKMEELLDLLIERQPQLSLVAIIDTMGFDRTAFIGEAYNSSYVKNYFDCCAWVYYQLSLDMMLDAIMKSLMPLSALSEILDNDFEMKKNTLHNYLKNKRYLIVIQDVWRGDIWDFLKEALPDHQNGSRILTALIHIVGLSSCRLENDEKIRLDLVPPKGKLRARQLYQLWIAEAFIPDNCESTAEEYLKELIDRGFIQVNKKDLELEDDPMPAPEKLPHLKVLKLKRSSYSGRKLVCGHGGFPRQEILHLKSMLWLEEWKMETGAMQKLKSLIVNPCAYLRKFPEELWRIKALRKLESWWPRPELRQSLHKFEEIDRLDMQIYPIGI